MNNRNDADADKGSETGFGGERTSITPGGAGSVIASQAAQNLSREKTGGVQPGAPPAGQKPIEQKPNPKRRRANFATMSNLMSKLVVKLGLDQRLKEHALMHLWPALVDDRFATNSRCLFIDNERKLVVSVQDASVGQELSLLRRDILRKMQIAANNLGVKIDGIRFDMKHFHKAEVEMEQAASYVNELPQASPEDLSAIDLSEEELAEIAALRSGPANPELIQGGTFTTRLHLGDRIATIFEHELRLKKWRATNGYPLCAECAEPSIQLHGDNRLCAHCFYKSISPKSI